MKRIAYPAAIQALIGELKRLPGIGPRSAERIALWMLQSRDARLLEIARVIREVHETIHACPRCGFFTTEALCEICSDPSREAAQICVIEQPTEILPLERTGAFRGRYHALGGRISPLDHVGPEDLRIDALIERIQTEAPSEIILALGSDVEGEATANYLASLLRDLPVAVTRLAQGLPAGGGLEQADELTLSLDGWEGPLDLLLSLSRAQKVDLAQISILQLVEQYLAYLNQARALKLEIAADYLVMAAWLAYLKSCLLLPKDPEQDPSPEEIALRLQMRLQRLDAMREAGARLLGRDRIGRDVFVRGAPEGLRLIRKAAWQVREFDLFAAYGAIRARTQPAMHVVHARAVMTLDEAIERVSRMIGMALEWTFLESFLPQSQDPQFRKSALASSFLAALELARRGRLEIAQDDAFSPIKLKAA